MKCASPVRECAGTCTGAGATSMGGGSCLALGDWKVSEVSETLPDALHEEQRGM